jgi:putative NADPH-quinone reductase
MSEHAVSPHTTLILLAHPDLAHSRINAALAAAASTLPGVQVHDLTWLYPDHRIDIAAEQELLTAADEIVLQYPTHWYSVPGLMKQWLDDVLTRGWAYGAGAPGALAGKTLRVVTSTGGAADAYATGEFHGWPYQDILIPLRATAKRLGMTWGEPLVIHGAREVTDTDLVALADRYRALLDPAAPALITAR